jgi:mycothiol system anti-sigma-R factor
MSCGDPHDMDCMEVLSLVYGFLDGEMDDAARERIREHLDECTPCLRQYGLERAVKSLLVRSCGCEHAPERLRVQVVTRIREVSVTLRVQPPTQG